MNENNINDTLLKYKNKRNREIKYYNEVLKNNDNFKIKNRQNSKSWYDNNKDKKKNYYLNNKEDLKLKSSFNYYKKNDKLDILKNKNPDKYQLMVDKGLII
tara:strand:- start:209 stop:511 length:303 start_codon:yes stop_codon:yes gene_type:complete